MPVQGATLAHDGVAVPDRDTERRLDRLRWWNVVVGLVLAVQAVLIALLTNGFSLPVTATFMTGPPGSARDCTTCSTCRPAGAWWPSSPSRPARCCSSPRRRFRLVPRNLLRQRNYGRWIEYFFSSSIMIVLISQLVGISDIAALMAIFAVNACMILFGLLMERYERPGKPSWLPFWFGSLRRDRALAGDRRSTRGRRA